MSHAQSDVDSCNTRANRRFEKMVLGCCSKRSSYRGLNAAAVTRSFVNRGTDALSTRCEDEGSPARRDHAKAADA